MDALVQMIFTGVFAAGGAYAAVRVKLDWMKERVDEAHKRIDDHDGQILELYKRG